MESHFSSIPTVEDDYLSIYFRLTHAPPLQTNYRVLKFLCQMTILYLTLVAEIHVEERSPFKTHYMLMIMSIILLSVGLVSGIVICAQKYLQSSMIDTYYKILETLCYFSSLMAANLIYFVYVLPKFLEWIGYLVMGVIFSIAVVWYPIEDYSVPPFYTILAPPALVLTMHLPDNFKWISRLIVFVNLVLYAVYELKSWKERRAREAMHAEDMAMHADKLAGLLHPRIKEDDTEIVF